jgi:hypothetical protein
MKGKTPFSIEHETDVLRESEFFHKLLKIDKSCQIELEKNSCGEELFQVFNDCMDDFGGNSANEDFSFNDDEYENGNENEEDYVFNSFDEDFSSNDEF